MALSHVPTSSRKVGRVPLLPQASKPKLQLRCKQSPTINLNSPFATLTSVDIAIMASIRGVVAPKLSRSICQQCRRSLTSRSFARAATTSQLQPRRNSPTMGTTTTPVTRIRWHSADFAKKSKVYEFNDIKQITESPSDERILIGTFTLPHKTLQTPMDD